MSCFIAVYLNTNTFAIYSHALQCQTHVVPVSRGHHSRAGTVDSFSYRVRVRARVGLRVMVKVRVKVSRLI